MTAHPPELTRARRRLESELGIIVSVASLPSGSTGASSLVETASGRYVVKTFRSGSDALLGPAGQFRLLEALAKTGIAPRPVAFDDEHSWLVTEFLENAVALSADELSRPETIAAVALCLRRLHSVAVAVPRFEPRSHAARYVGRIGGPGRLSAPDRERYDELHELASEIVAEPVVLCHNDLVAENLLRIGNGIRLIDFDYAALAPSVIDLASLVTMNEFTDRDTSLLLGAYFGERAAPTLREFARVQRLVRLLAHFWALASADLGPAIVAQYGIPDD